MSENSNTFDYHLLYGVEFPVEPAISTVLKRIQQLEAEVATLKENSCENCKCKNKKKSFWFW